MKSLLNIEISDPGTSYKATRFDWTAVFGKVIFDGKEFAGRWFDGNDPLKHDNLCGMSEEFLPVWLPDGSCFKPGVGILDLPARLCRLPHPRHRCRGDLNRISSH